MNSELWCDPKITGFQYNALMQYNSFNKKGTWNQSKYPLKICTDGRITKILRIQIVNKIISDIN